MTSRWVKELTPLCSYTWESQYRLQERQDWQLIDFAMSMSCSVQPIRGIHQLR
jgi:hypothetical protein